MGHYHLQDYVECKIKVKFYVYKNLFCIHVQFCLSSESISHQIMYRNVVLKLNTVWYLVLVYENDFVLFIMSSVLSNVCLCYVTIIIR